MFINIFGMSGAMSAFLIMYFLFIFTIVAALYIIYSLFLYKIGKDVSDSSKWMAWVPILNSYYPGKLASILSDDFAFFKKFCISFCGFITTLAIQATLLIATLASQESVLAILTSFFALLFFVVAVVFTVFSYMALYRIFQAYSPENAALFIVLSILVPFAAQIIFIIIMRQLNTKGYVKQIIDPERFNLFFIFRP